MRLLVVYNESPFWEEALRFAHKVCAETTGEYVVLGIASNPKAIPEMEQTISRSIPDGMDLAPVIRQGEFFQQILDEIDENGYDMAMIGADPVTALPPQQLVTTEYLAQLCPIPLAIVRRCLETWNQVLICARSPNPTLQVIQTGKKLAKLLQTDTKILHVLPPTDKEDQEPEIAGVTLRYGAIREQIDAEINTHNHGIVVIGAHKVPALVPSDGITLALPDITHQILQLETPVLIITGRSIPQLDIVEQPALARDQDLAKLLSYAAIEIVIYGTLIVIYAAVVFHFLDDILDTLFIDNLALYAVVALLLIVGQGVLLDGITSFLLDRLRLERFD